MGYNFSDEDKEVREFNESLPFGITEVQVTGAVADVTEAGKDFIAVGVVNEQGIEDEVRLWFTGGASNISFNTLRQIAVHCVGDDETAKEEVRKRVDAVKDGDELATLITEICTGKKIWYTKYYDAKGRTYTTENGTFKSVNKNIMGYEPTLKPELMPSGSQPFDTGTGSPDDITPLDGRDITNTSAAAGIPKDGDWAK